MQITVVRRLIGLGHQHFDVLAHDFFRRPAEQAFRRAIEVLDDAFSVDGDNAVDSRFQRGAQTRTAFIEAAVQLMRANQTVYRHHHEGHGNGERRQYQ